MQRRRRCARRLRALAVAGSGAVAWAGTTALVVWAGRGPATAVRAPGPARLEDLLGLVAAVGCWLALTWLAAGVVLCAASAVRGGGGRLAPLARRLAPAGLRRAVGTLVGAAVVTGTLGAGAAAAALGPGGPGGPGAPAAPAAVVAVVGGPAALGVDRPGAAPQAIAPGAIAPGAAAATAGTDLAGWTPDRPAAPAAPQRAADELRLVAAVPRAEATDEVVVHRGDTLWEIARRALGPDAGPAEVAAAWPRWHEANRDVIGDDPELIRPGQVLRAPA